MCSVCIYLCVLLSASCVLCQMTLLESGPRIVKASETLKLSCKVTGYSISSNCWNWIRQPPGKGLEWLARICYDSSTYYSESLKSRLSITRDTSKNEFYLQMSSVKPEESATYYGARDSHGWGAAVYFDYWGQGTTVTVTTVQSKAPSLFPLISYGASKDPVAVGCLAKDFLPESVDFSWTDKNNSSFTSGFRKFQSILGSSGTYTTSSHVQVPLSNWESYDPYYCKVTHTALEQPLVKKVIKKVSRIIQPTVTLHPPIMEDIANHNATIVCMCRGFYPESISVTWLKDGKKVTSGINTEGPVANGAGEFAMTSWLDITASDWNRNILYSCNVDHTSSNYWNSKNISKTLVCEASNSGSVSVDVFTIAPTFEEVFESKSAKLTCAVSNMMDEKSLKITWIRDDTKELQKTTITNVVLSDNGTYSATGIAMVCADDWAAGHKFVCRVSHEELAAQKNVELQKKNGTPTSQPVVFVYPPPSEEVALKEYVTILCVVRRYNPCDIFVKWLREKKEIPKMDYINTKPIEEVEPTSGLKTCLMYSSLKVNEQEWSSGTVFTCVVGHEALPMQITQKSIDKSSGKPTAINVSLVMSESASNCY